MKRTLIILALTLTSSIANISTPLVTNNSKHITIEKKSEIITREIRTSRNIRPSRQVRKTRVVPALRFSRESREIHNNRFIVQETRKKRKTRHLLSQDNLYFANLK